MRPKLVARERTVYCVDVDDHKSCFKGGKNYQNNGLGIAHRSGRSIIAQQVFQARSAGIALTSIHWKKRMVDGSSPNEPQKRSFRERVDDHPIRTITITAVAAFGLGVWVYPAIYTAAKLETIHTEELSRLRSEIDQLRQKQRETGREAAKERSNPTVMPVTVVEQPAKWLARLVSLLNIEALFEKSTAPELNERFGVGAAESVLSSATTPFNWRLKPRPSYRIAAWAYRVTQDGRLIQPLEGKVDPEGSWLFSVPECLAGDKLVATVRAKWSHDSLVNNITETFESDVEKE